MTLYSAVDEPGGWGSICERRDGLLWWPACAVDEVHYYRRGRCGSMSLYLSVLCTYSRVPICLAVWHCADAARTTPSWCLWMRQGNVPSRPPAPQSLLGDCLCRNRWLRQVLHGTVEVACSQSRLYPVRRHRRWPYLTHTQTRYRLAICSRSWRGERRPSG